MKKIILIFMLATLVACSPVDSVKPFDQEQVAILLKENMRKKPAHHSVALNLPTKWQTVNAESEGLNLRLLPQGASPENWQESISTNIQAYQAHATNLKTFILASIKTAALTCKQSRLTVLQNSKNGTSDVYRLDLKGCQDTTDKVQISKAFAGQDAIYQVNYVAKAGVSSAEINKMENVIREAQLT